MGNKKTQLLRCCLNMRTRGAALFLLKNKKKDGSSLSASTMRMERKVELAVPTHKIRTLSVTLTITEIISR